MNHMEPCRCLCVLWVAGLMDAHPPYLDVKDKEAP